jgi:hypothetical protein
MEMNLQADIFTPEDSLWLTLVGGGGGTLN